VSSYDSHHHMKPWLLFFSFFPPPLSTPSTRCEQDVDTRHKSGLVMLLCIYHIFRIIRPLKQLNEP
jgi:hypothetical protein